MRKTYARSWMVLSCQYEPAFGRLDHVVERDGKAMAVRVREGRELRAMARVVQRHEGVAHGPGRFYLRDQGRVLFDLHGVQCYVVASGDGAADDQQADRKHDRDEYGYAYGMCIRTGTCHVSLR